METNNQKPFHFYFLIPKWKVSAFAYQIIQSIITLAIVIYNIISSLHKNCEGNYSFDYAILIGYVVLGIYARITFQMTISGRLPFSSNSI